MKKTEVQEKALKKIVKYMRENRCDKADMSAIPINRNTVRAMEKKGILEIVSEQERTRSFQKIYNFGRVLDICSEKYIYRLHRIIKI